MPRTGGLVWKRKDEWEGADFDSGLKRSGVEFALGKKAFDLLKVLMRISRVRRASLPSNGTEYSSDEMEKSVRVFSYSCSDQHQ